MDASRYDVAVVGAGAIGLAVAWRARARGLSVLLCDRGEPGGGTSGVAAGMLAPVAEADAQERALLALNLEAARRWPSFAAELRDVSGIDPRHRPCGTLLVARDRDEAESVERELELRERLGLEARRVLPSEARRLEPALAPGLRLAAEFPNDHAAEPRLLCGALAAACTRAGVELVPRRPVASVDELDAERVVIAAGSWSGALGDVPVRPVKGQALLLRDPAGARLIERVVRFDGGYLVPREDGRVYLGATMEEQGFDTALTALALHDLLRDAAEVVPGVLELEIEETLVGLRPATPDNAPVIGADPRDPRIVWATGHHRNGILLAPVTADLVAAELCGEPVEHAFGPGRFARAAEVVA